MTISNHERVGRALNLLCQGLYPYLKQEMQAVYSNNWEKEAKSCLANHKPLKQKSADSILSEDVATLLSVMSKQWDKVFTKNLNSPENGLVVELIQVRNNWAHRPLFFSTADTYRALDSIARLLKAVSASEADIKEVEKQQQEVLRILSQEQIRQENRHVSAEEVRIRKRLSDLLKQLPFQDASLLNQALTHRSYFYENPGEAKDNELLEFLGDALLTFLSGEYLYRRYYSDKNKKEGELTQLRSLLVKDKQLAKFAATLNISQWMLLGRGEATNGGTAKESLLSNTFEAIIGAYFLDSGIEAVRNFVEPLFTQIVEQLISSESDPDSNIPVDKKNQLQQWAQKTFRQTPVYSIINESGLDHAKEFTVIVCVNDTKYGEGKGHSKKDAEKVAAEEALSYLKQQYLL